MANEGRAHSVFSFFISPVSAPFEKELLTRLLTLRRGEHRREDEMRKASDPREEHETDTQTYREIEKERTGGYVTFNGR